MPSLLSQSLYCWLVGPLWKAFRGPLQEHEAPELFFSRSACVFDTRGREWRTGCRESGHAERLWRVLLFRLSPRAFVGGLVSLLLTGIATTVGRPLALRYVVLRIGDTDLNNIELLGLVCLLGAVVLAEGLLTVWGKLLVCDTLCVKAFAFLANVLVDKAASGPVGNMHNPTNLLGNDLVRIVENAKWSSMLLSSITGIIGGVTMLLWIIGPSSLVGLAVSFAIMALNVRMSKVTQAAERANLQASDDRLRLLKQTLDMIRGVKYFAWEERCLAQITAARVEECAKIRRFRAFQMLAVNLGRMSPVLSCLVTFVFYAVLLGEPMKAEDIFGALVIFQSMRVSLIMIPANMASLANVALSLTRIERFCTCPDFCPRNLLPDGSGNLAELSFEECIPGQLAVQGKDPAQDNGTVDLRRFVLQGVELNVAQGALVAVLGPVGSGKSTLVNALLGAAQLHGGKGARTCKNVSLVTQKPVTLNATVLENVLMGLPYSESLWTYVVEAAQLQRDLELLPDGRDTLIGENGTTLSGGQQMRVSIARALYTEPDLLVLDDPLAALDHVVGSAVLSSVASYVKKERAGHQRAAVMVLNQLHLLSKFDHAICLDGGIVQAQGTPSEVARTLGLDLVANHHGNVDDSAQDDSTLEVEPVGDAAQLLKKPTVPQLTKGATVAALTSQQAERRNQGNVSSSVYATFIKAMGPCLTFLSCSTLVLAYLSMVFADWWLSYWVQQAGDEAKKTLYPAVYSVGTILHAVAMTLASLLFAEAGMRASKTLHFDCLIRVMKAPMAWFEDTPSGRIVSRFSSDLNMVDLQLTLCLDNLLQISLATLLMLAMVVVIVPIVAVAIVLGMALYYLQSVMVDRMNREVKRMRDTAMSPVQTNLSETLGCAPLLQADAREGRLRSYFLRKSFTAVDEWNRHTFTSMSLMNFGQLTTYFLSFGFCLATSAAILLGDAVEPEVSSLAFTYCFMAPYFLGILAQLVVMTNHTFTSLERLIDLKSPEHVPSESWPAGPTFELQSDVTSWPAVGEIIFEAVQLRYRPNLPLAVSDVSFHVKGGERFGILGRTGSGKSSLLVLLFRLVEPAAGRVLVDGIDVSTLGLHKLRSSLGMIPQTPVILAGTVRQNLNPFDDVPGGDAALLHVLEKAELGHLSLDAQVGSGGGLLSVGECQLLSFARCFLQDTRIIVLDEPTASVDTETDAKLQALIRHAFSGKTLMCIAHRLQTIIDFDRLLVMNAGRVAGLGPPKALLDDTSSALSRIVDGGGGNLRGELEKILNLAEPGEAQI